MPKKASKRKLKQPNRGRLGDLGNAAADVSQLVELIIQYKIIPQVSSLLGNLVTASGDVQSVAANVKSASDFIPQVIAWIKSEFAKPAPASVMGPFRRPPRPPIPVIGDVLAESATFQEYGSSTSRSLAQILSILQAESNMLNTIGAAVQQLISAPAGIGQVEQATLIAELKASASKLQAAIAANTHS